MLLVLLVLISVGLALWLEFEGFSFFGNAIIFCFCSVFIWLLVLFAFQIFLPTVDIETELIIDGFDYDSSFPNDSLCYIVDDKIYRVAGDVTVFDGGSKNTLVIVEKYLDTPDWFWLISFSDHSRLPWSIVYYIR